MDRQQILAAIKRVALDNGGRAPGREAFESVTGVRMAEWYPHLWLRWGDALSDAGYEPNALQAKMSDDSVIEKYVGFMPELGRVPVEGEIRRKAREDQSFPSHSVFGRFGGKQKLLEAVAAYCQRTTGTQDVLPLCANSMPAASATGTASREARIATEFVYLMKSGKHYKIGRTNSLGRRGSELSIKIPVPPTTIHSIETDDAIGVESYWHRRFADKRGEGE
jgi:hypothetical protein